MDNRKDDTLKMGYSEPIGGPQNTANPPDVVVSSSAPVEIIGGANNTANPPDVVIPGGVGVTNTPNVNPLEQNYSSDQDHYVGGYSVGPLAANYSYIQLWNPIGSGVSLILQRLIQTRIVSGTSGLTYLIRYDTALTSLAINGNNKDFNIAVGGGKGQVRYEQNAALLGTVLSYFQNSEQPTEILKDTNKPYILPEGKGIVVAPNSVQFGIRAHFEWKEV